MPTPTCDAMILGLLLGATSAGLFAQEAPPPPASAVTRAIGEVSSVEPSASRLTLRTDAGATVVVAVDAQTAVLRARPGAADLRDATPLTLAEVGVGDRVLARGGLGREGVLVAGQVVVMAGADLAEKRERERAEWLRRGVAGVVKGLDPTTREITLEARGLAGGQTLVLPAGADAVVFKRYAPDSVKFSDARPSSFTDVEVGDQLRALGERSADGTRFVPEQIVTGAFRSVTATITHVERETGVLTVSEVATRARLSVVVSPASVLKRLTPEVGARLMRRWSEAEAGAVRGTEPRAMRWRARERPAAEHGAGPPRGPSAGMTLGDMLERLPSLTLADLKEGDLIVFSSTRGAASARLAAITLVAGLEALAPPSSQRGRSREVTLGLASEALDLGMDLP